jgi:hypothetical protein
LPYYRLYHVRRGHFIRCDEIQAEDDVAAEQAARAFMKEDPCELWRGSRKIADLSPQG